MQSCGAAAGRSVGVIDLCVRRGEARGRGRQEGRDARRVRSRLEEPSVRTLARRGRADGVEADEYRVVLEEALIN